MNKDQVHGTIDDVAGRAKRQVGEWTGDTKTQLEGLGQQVKGKAEKALGTVKDAVRDGHEQVKEKARKAWEIVPDPVRDGQVEDKRRRQAGQMRDEGDLDPVYQSGNEAEKPRSSQR